MNPYFRAGVIAGAGTAALYLAFLFGVAYELNRGHK